MRYRLLAAVVTMTAGLIVTPAAAATCPDLAPIQLAAGPLDRREPDLRRLHLVQRPVHQGRYRRLPVDRQQEVPDLRHRLGQPQQVAAPRARTQRRRAGSQPGVHRPVQN